MNKKIVLAQIGCGYWGPNLLRNLVSNKRCEVESVADMRKTRRDFVKKNYPNVNVDKDIDEILNNKRIDAVVVSTPAYTHYDLAIKFLESGKHVLVEKPMAGSVEEVKEIGRIAKRKELVAMSGHTFIYNPAVRYLKEVIDSGRLGRVRYIYSQRLNLGRIRSDVDVLWNFAPHDVSIIQYLLGGLKPVSVKKHGMSYIQKGIDDVVFFNLMYPNKIIANIHVSWLDPCKVRKMVVVGSKKMVVYDDIAESKIMIYDKGIEHMAILGKNMDFDGSGIVKLTHRSGKVVSPKIEFVEPLKIEINHFIDCIERREECLTGIDHTIGVIDVISRGF